jgi:hypothetical protein
MHGARCAQPPPRTRRSTRSGLLAAIARLHANYDEFHRTESPIQEIALFALGEDLGRERMHFNLELAVAKYLAFPATEHAV